MGTNRPPKYPHFETKGPILGVFIINYTDYQALIFSLMSEKRHL